MWSTWSIDLWPIDVASLATMAKKSLLVDCWSTAHAHRCVCLADALLLLRMVSFKSRFQSTILTEYRLTFHVDISPLIPHQGDPIDTHARIEHSEQEQPLHKIWDLNMSSSDLRLIFSMGYWQRSEGTYLAIFLIMWWTTKCRHPQAYLRASIYNQSIYVCE